MEQVPPKYPPNSVGDIFEETYIEDYVIDKYKEAQEDITATLGLKKDVPLIFMLDDYFVKVSNGMWLSNEDNRELVIGGGDRYFGDKIIEVKTFGSYTFILTVVSDNYDCEYKIFKSENERKEEDYV